VWQRGGLGIGHKHPLYVLSVDAEKNELTVGKKEDLKSGGLVAGEVNLLARNLPEKAYAKIRYNQKEAKCKVYPSDRGGEFRVIFEEAQEAVTPGQSVVLYDGDTVLGGGVIEKRI
jgi:tRNA-specific 2-thiouridylase